MYGVGLKEAEGGGGQRAIRMRSEAAQKELSAERVRVFGVYAAQSWWVEVVGVCRVSVI